MTNLEVTSDFETPSISNVEIKPLTNQNKDNLKRPTYYKFIFLKSSHCLHFRTVIQKSLISPTCRAAPPRSAQGDKGGLGEVQGKEEDALETEAKKTVH